MRVIDVVIEILKREGVEFLSCYPTTPLIDAAAEADLRPILCRQERVGVGIADGFSRVTNGRRPGVFAMQFGPGAENAFAGVATAYNGDLLAFEEGAVAHGAEGYSSPDELLLSGYVELAGHRARGNDNGSRLILIVVRDDPVALPFWPDLRRFLIDDL